MELVNEITYEGIKYKINDIVKIKWGIEHDFIFIGQIKAITNDYKLCLEKNTGGVFFGEAKNIISKIKKCKIIINNNNFNYKELLISCIKDNTFR